jgi:hypothetical protein
MNKILIALGVLLLVARAASAQWLAPEVVTTYYPAPVYAAPAPYVAPAPVAYSTFYTPPIVVGATPVVVARPRVAYYAAPAVFAPPVAVAPAPVVVGRPVVVRSKVYYPGRPIRNTVRYLVP